MQSCIKVVLQAFSALGGPLASRASALLSSGDFVALSELKVRPSDYTSAHHYLRDAQVAALCRKMEGLPGLDPEAEAFKVWRAAEEQCFNTNRRFAGFLEGHYGDYPPAFASVLDDVRKVFRQVCGRLPRREEICGRFSSGSTVNRDPVHPFTVGNKVQAGLYITPSASLLGSYLMRDTAWGRLCDAQVRTLPRDYEEFFVVPKDARCGRGCRKGASLNVWAQLGIDLVLRDRLRRVGIVLEEAQVKHQSLVRSCSRSGELSTIDLSSASDTMATNVIQFVASEGWFALLDTLRARLTVANGRTYVTDSFSSMGNGFTFPLQTVLFYSIATVACHGKRVWVYGDDIIVPSEHFEETQLLLRFFGFTPNPSKSFGPGSPFRESCGADYWLGVDVRPEFVYKVPSGPVDWINLHNKLVRIEERLCVDMTAAKRLCLQEIPKALRLWGPPSMSDCTLTTHNRAKWVTRPGNGSGELVRRRYSCVSRLRFHFPFGGGVPQIRVCASQHDTVSIYSYSDWCQLVLVLLGSKEHIGYRNNITGYRRKWRPLLP